MDRYSQPTIIGRYIEAEWGDLLLRYAAPQKTNERLYSFGDRTVSFYNGICQFLQDRKIAPQRIVDVGSATGRLLLELGRTFPEAEEIIGCEPSPEFHKISRSLLKNSPPVDWLPVPDSPTGACDYVKVGDQFRQAAIAGSGVERIQLENCAAESVPRPGGYFDLICCLNVVDRHPDPERLLEILKRLIRVDGYLCLASPMDWKEETTPKDRVTDDLGTLVDSSDWSLQAEVDLEYIFRSSTRRIISYFSQVLLVQKVE